MTSDETKEQLANIFLESLRAKDWAKMRTIMNPEIVWSLPGSSRISGEAGGVDAVIERCQIITSYGLNFALKHVLYGESGFALSLNNTAQRDGLVLNEYLATVCSIGKDRIVRIDTYLSDVPMANKFFAVEAAR